MIRLRTGGAGDARELAALFTASVHELGKAYYDDEQRRAWASPEPDLARWQDRLAALNVLVAGRNGQTAGFIAFTPDGYIDLLFTAPAHARHGVARALFLAAERHLHALGTYDLHTHASRVARPFFEQVGFTVLAPETVDRDGVALERFAMRKCAAPA
ncbi:acetyltransferase [Arenimonas soli]|uniref:Acetyltransferase n=1 Tax=Arenimonas soli TaxID=2269504 RepID=A0ABQ1HCN1_9GAMM|nr:GNAT family N-acetyltransferase [Arenimonas soli]GGA69655.1 acetyltransferase [Arenimonas soli]